MVQALTQPVTFDEFIAWLPENSEHRYELHRGAIVEMSRPKGNHSEIAGFLNGSLFVDRAQLPYFIPKECLVRISDDTAYEPDGIVLDRQMIINDPRWQTQSTITQGRSARLVIEVVSTNWRDDYDKKFSDYEALGIPEYWIVDYLGLGGRRHIGAPKQPTFSICELIDGEYEIRRFRGSDPCGICEAARMVSPAFPDLELTVDSVFQR